MNAPAPTTLNKIRSFGRDEYSIHTSSELKRRAEGIVPALKAAKTCTNDRAFARRIHKFQNKLNQGKVTANDAVIMCLDSMLDSKGH